MKLLLDTHTFIWWDSTSKYLSSRAFNLILDPTNVLIVSVVSIWEIQIKAQTGKLTLRGPLADIVAQQQTANNIFFLPVTQTHIFGLDRLPLAHKDPFDRLLAAQALTEAATLVTVDPIFAAYPVSTIW